MDQACEATIEIFPYASVAIKLALITGLTNAETKTKKRCLHTNSGKGEAFLTKRPMDWVAGQDPHFPSH